ncbi:hypothetical protein J4438_02170 [Candidatus Woesearchaeota archaeon]|nr:hypothetical protein [Candidatus Woesearchaeota archaeon]
MPKPKVDLQSLHSEVQVGVSITAFMTGVTIFFAGLLITNFENPTIAIEIPILFLIISTFGFLYSTLVYANASGELNHFNSNRFNKYMMIGNTVSEYIGVYFLVLCIPLVINVVTQSLFIKIATLTIALVGLIIYHSSGCSIMGRDYKKLHYLFLLLIILLELILFLTQTMYQSYFVYFASIMILFLITISFLSKKIKN